MTDITRLPGRNCSKVASAGRRDKGRRTQFVTSGGNYAVVKVVVARTQSMADPRRRLPRRRRSASAFLGRRST